MLKRITQMKERGDTIVEVMIVLAILGLALSICYATANRSLLNTRQAQENGEATELVRAQVEALRTLACDTHDSSCHRPNEIKQLNQAFCLKLNSSTGKYEAVTATGGTDFGIQSNCDQGSLPYRVTVTLIDTSTTTYAFRAEWESVQGATDHDTVTLNYRLP